MVLGGGASLGSAVLELRADASRLKRDFDRAEQQAVQRTRQIGERLRGIGFIAAGLGAPIAAFAGLSIRAASSLQESINAVNVVFGDAAETIHQFGETSAQTVLLSQAAFNQLGAQTGALLKNFGFSQQEAAEQTTILAQRAADLASVFDTDVKRALNAINAALRGETEPIRFYAADVTDDRRQLVLPVASTVFAGR